MALVKQYDTRGGERFDVQGEVTLRVYLTRTNDVREVRARLVNLGVGGLYVEALDNTLPIGALADLEIQLDGCLATTTLGLVRWYENGKGAGIEFFYSTDADRDALHHYLLEWQCGKRGPRERSPESVGRTPPA